MARLLADLGHPERKLPPAIHVAGTNGKGSVVATMRALLEAAGYRVHVYTSPHLVRFNERIRLAGILIAEDDLAAMLEEVERVNDGRPITFFEVTTAAAFLAFARTPADAVLLEVGLGGRLDATNLIDRPLASVITPVSMDHMHYLGDTIEKIAGEKAGILKRDVPAVIGLQPDGAFDVIEAHAAIIGTIRFRRGKEWDIARRPDGFSYRGRRSVDLPLPSLPGAHQIDNAALAVAALDAAGDFRISDEQLRTGLGRIDWPARLQRLASGRLAAVLKPGAELWLDGGHNEDAGRILADWLAKQDGRTDIVCGMLSTKEAEKFLAHLVPYTARFRAIAVPGEQASLPSDALADAARRVGIKDAATADSIVAAVSDLARTARRVLICGSLYLAGHVLAENGQTG